MIVLTRRYRFSASHRLESPALSPEQNRALYGKCNNPYGHGHDYVLEVSVRGPLDPATGLAVDVAALDGLVRQRILAAFDHRNLNIDAAGLDRVIPTTENLAHAIRERLAACWQDTFRGSWPRLERIRIAETPRNVFELNEGK